MKTANSSRKFTPLQIKQASNINLEDYYHHRLSVFGITIDDASTVDRDDGIWLVELNNGDFELQVSITDVSTIIPKNSPIDEEALTRVVTAYHTNPPTPMLPCHISTNLGSLEEEKKRLALTIFFQIDHHGNVNSFTIKETIFTNKKAFSYTEVEEILKNPQDIPEHKLLRKMQKVSQLIAKKRGGNSGILTRDGYIDEDGNLIKENVNTYQLIAELMILTNTTIAHFLAEKKIPALYRTQDVGTTDFEMVKKTMGHCLVPAIYHPYPLPHVGLCLTSYTHFTSPLRRYVDLVNHRIIRAILHGKSSPYSEEELKIISKKINKFFEVFKQEKSQYIREKKIKETKYNFEHIDTLNQDKLSPNEFSDLIEYAIDNNQVEKILPYVNIRLNTLQPKDFYYLWFVAKVNDFFEYFNHEDINVSPILLVKNQLDNSEIKYKSQYSYDTKLYYIHCYIDDLTTMNPAVDLKKNKAKQKAGLATIKSYVCGELTATPFPLEGLSIIDEENPLDSDISSLNDKDFSKILDYCLKTNFEETIIEEIEKRISQLPPKDLYKIWFQGRINKFFEVDNLNAVSVLLIHSQLTGYKVEYHIDYLSVNQEYIAYCEVEGLTHPHPQYDSKKTKAKQKAALAYIQSYLENNLINTVELEKEKKALIQQQEITKNTDSSPDNQKMDKPEDWVSKLHHFCQLHQLESPDYQFINIDGFLTCIMNLKYHDRVLMAKGYGKSKKEAKQKACQVFTIQHESLFKECGI